MDFYDSPEEAQYRAQVKAWLAANAPAFEIDAQTAPAGAMMEKARGWQRCKADAGYVGIMWPKKVGGQGGTPIQHVIFHQEEERYRVPIVPYQVGIGMCLPTLFTHGSPEVVERYMEPGMRGEELWCQLFSEPAAGSDLAGLRTRAVKDGDDWIINGQKVWTSFAHEADYGILLVRTDPEKPKHKGLTMFYINMRTPGVEVRPIKTLLGDAEFNEVFFTGVRIPDSQRLGAVNDGWNVSLSTLMFERLAVGGKPAGSPDAAALLDLVDGEQACSAMAQALAKFYVTDEGISLTRMRSLTAVSRGGVPGPEASINKLVMAKNLQDMCAYALELLGNDGLREQDDPVVRRFSYWYLWSAGLRIAGGTDEILRNIIAERVLGLPPEPRNDRDTPFNQLK